MTPARGIKVTVIPTGAKRSACPEYAAPRGGFVRDDGIIAEASLDNYLSITYASTNANRAAVAVARDQCRCQTMQAGQASARRLPHYRKYRKFPPGKPAHLAAGSANCANPRCVPPCDVTDRRDQPKTVSRNCRKCRNSPADHPAPMGAWPRQLSRQRLLHRGRRLGEVHLAGVLGLQRRHHAAHVLDRLGAGGGHRLGDGGLRRPPRPSAWAGSARSRRSRPFPCRPGRRGCPSRRARPIRSAV